MDNEDSYYENSKNSIDYLGTTTKRDNRFNNNEVVK